MYYHVLCRVLMLTTMLLVFSTSRPAISQTFEPDASPGDSESEDKESGALVPTEGQVNEDEATDRILHLLRLTPGQTKTIPLALSEGPFRQGTRDNLYLELTNKPHKKIWLNGSPFYELRDGVEASWDNSGVTIRATDQARPGHLDCLIRYRSFQFSSPGGFVAGLRIVVEQAPLTEPAANASIVSEIDGVWRLTRSHENGEWIDETSSEFIIFRWNGQQVILKNGKSFSHRAFQVDPAQKPSEITFDDPPHSKQKQGPSLGIYQLDGNRLTLAILKDGMKRSAKRPFDFKPDDTKWLYEYERVH